jgi:hypothetical protein
MAQDLVRQVADELEIRNIIARLAQLADTGDPTEYGSLFTEDAIWEVRPNPGEPPQFPAVKGRAAVVAALLQRRADKLSGPGTHYYHNIGTTSVKVTGDTATARSNMFFLKNANTKPEISMLRIYNDQYVRTKDGWKLAVRYIDPS